MINEERVKEQFSAALYDKNERNTHEQVSTYFMKDYIVKEVLKSIFSGTLAFMGLLALYMMYNLDTIVADINSVDLIQIATEYVMVYVAFIAAYIFVTVLIYALRYNKGRKKLRSNGEHLKKIKKMYEREEKLKL